MTLELQTSTLLQLPKYLNIVFDEETKVPEAARFAGVDVAPLGI